MSYSNRSGLAGKNGKLTISGNTYTHRETIKAWGGKYNPTNKTWTIPAPSNNRDASQLAYQLRTMGLVAA